MTLIIVVAVALAVIKNALQMISGRASPVSPTGRLRDFDIERGIIYLSYSALFFAFVNSPERNSLISLSVCIALICFGSLLSMVAIKAFSGTHNENIVPSGDGGLKTTGIYGLTRHPMRLGLLLELLGMVISIQGTWSSLLFLGVCMLLAVRTQREEKLLQQCFGSVYDDYKTNVPIIPKLSPRMLVNLAGRVRGRACRIRPEAASSATAK